VPLVTVARASGRTPTDIQELADLVRAHDAVEVVVGLPISLSGAETGAARHVRDYSVTLAVRVAPVPVRLVDERLTTVSAAQGLRRSGVRGRKQRAVIDQVAATHLLQSALDAERTAGRPPGEIVQVRS
jgi:putative Holliday junction resolvase